MLSKIPKLMTNNAVPVIGSATASAGILQWIDSFFDCRQNTIGYTHILDNVYVVYENGKEVPTPYSGQELPDGVMPIKQCKRKNVEWTDKQNKIWYANTPRD